MSQFLISDTYVRAYVRTFYNYCLLVFVVSEI
nr:MAG TPA: hypothetical protein [Caudoviricetes sp.]